MKLLVGSTGFVGSNLLMTGAFDAAYHRTDVQDAYGSRPDLLVYAGLPAAKFLANQNPAADMACIEEAEQNICRIAPKKLVLISTIDVLKNPAAADEDSPVDEKGLPAYGLNRYRLECWARENYPDALIVRLPGLFGKNLKKNFLYDMLHPVPSLLAADRIAEFLRQEPVLADYYTPQENGFYRLKRDADAEKKLLPAFKRLGFSAVKFTDSRSTYQFYPLYRLWQDINIALQSDIRLLHLAAEPVSAAEIYHDLTGQEFVNCWAKTPAAYDYYTKYAELFGGSGHYIMSKAEVLQEIRTFMGEERER